jgi:hypothetical protein
MNKRIIFTVAGALLLFGGPLVLPASDIGPVPSARAITVSPA